MPIGHDYADNCNAFQNAREGAAAVPLRSSYVYVSSIKKVNVHLANWLGKRQGFHPQKSPVFLFARTLSPVLSPSCSFALPWLTINWLLFLIIINKPWDGYNCLWLQKYIVLGFILVKRVIVYYAWICTTKSQKLLFSGAFPPPPFLFVVPLPSLLFPCSSLFSFQLLLFVVLGFVFFAI